MSRVQEGNSPPQSESVCYMPKNWPELGVHHFRHDCHFWTSYFVVNSILKEGDSEDLS